MDLLVTGDISLASDMRIFSHVFVMWSHIWGSRIQTNFLDDANLGFQQDDASEKEASFEELPLSGFPVGISVGHFLDY